MRKRFFPTLEHAIPGCFRVKKDRRVSETAWHRCDSVLRCTRLVELRIISH